MGKVIAIVAAAGCGSRMRIDVKKQYFKINDKPILYYTLKNLCSCKLIDEIVISTSGDEIQYCKNEIVLKYKFSKVTNIIEGGDSRQRSVYNALCAIKNCDIVLIHDGVRPFIDTRIISDGIKYARLYGGAACGVTPKDTIKIKDERGFSLKTLQRSTLFCVETPQTFKYDIILKCHEKAALEKLNFTDDTAVIEQYGYKVFLYEGSYDNIKITTREDLITARELIEKYEL